MRKQNQSHIRIMQSKIPTASEKPKLPNGPPVYRPQPIPKVLQRKSEVKQPSAAPPVYRVQPTPKVLQRKVATDQRLQNPLLQRKSIAQPVLPRPVIPVSQAKTAESKPHVMNGQFCGNTNTPPAHRPQQRQIAQTKNLLRKPSSFPRVVQRMEDGADKKAEHKIRTPAKLPAPSNCEVTARQEAPSTVRRSKDGRDLILTAPQIFLRAAVSRDGLPDGVLPTDQFGWIQTIYCTNQRAFYDRIYHDDGKNEVRGYQALSRRLLPVPVRDGGMHPIFYDGPKTFEDLSAAAVWSNPSSLGVVLTDSPQDLYPLRTPDGHGVLSSISSTFDATAWFVAVRDGHIVHYFSHCDWQVHYRASVDLQGNIEWNGTRLTFTTGSGLGARRPAFTERVANEVARTSEWSIPEVDPLGLM